MATPGKLAILVGGGPAPGINSVISAATIRGILERMDVIGIEDGFEWIMQGDAQHVTPLTIDSVSRQHFQGGSIIGLSRANPTTDGRLLDASLQVLRDLGVNQLITIGGDDTLRSAIMLWRRAKGWLRIVHVPKTIDNDLDLPGHINTFGFQTARHFGGQIVQNLMTDARTSSHWYLVVAMGRKAGHLALGIGKASGVTLTLIREEFPAGALPLRTIVDSVVGSIIKRLSDGRRDGVVMLAEGLALDLDLTDSANLEHAERDAHGNVRLAEVDLGEMVKRGVVARLHELDLKATLVAKNIGYELRCADPIPDDIEYTRDLGYCATKFLIEGGDAALVSMQGGHFVPLWFDDLVAEADGHPKVRLVDIASTRYAIARRYMIRLRRDDFESPEKLARLASTAGLSEAEFRNQFDYLLAYEPPPLHLQF